MFQSAKTHHENENNMKRFLLPALLLAALFVLPGYVFSQTKMKLAGTVSDSSKALALVTVRIFKKNNPAAPLLTTLSKEDGSFQFNKPDTGNYILSFTHTGFTEKRISITVASRVGDMQIDPVQLIRATGLLKEVVVKAQRPLIEQADDKIVFNVEDDPNSKTETAIDILRRTPFVTVDGNDNVKVNGQTNFKVLLNGRETSMFANNVTQALRGFPGAIISKIEVITSPSAKYDGEGIGGLINIITKKKVVGYNGTLSSFNRSSDKVGNYSVNGNAKTGRFGLSVFMSKGNSNPVSQHNTSTTIPTLPNIYKRRMLDGDQAFSQGWSFGNIELNYEIDTLNTVSVYTNINSFSSKTVSDQTITTDFASSPSSLSNYDLNNKSNNPGVNVGSDYVRHFKKNKDQEFSLRFLGEFGKNDAKLNSFQEGGGSDRYLINNSYAINDQYTLQADNVIPITKTSRFEGGVKAILRRASSNFESLVKYDPAMDYKLNPSNTDYFKYTQHVVSLYSTYSFKLNKWNLRLGARVEYTNVNGNFISSNTQVKSNYTTLLPNIQFTRRVNPAFTLVLSYTKRLQRPYIYDLNPFVVNNDSLNISYGNPDLGPQTIHVISTQLRYGKKNTFAGINIQGSYSANKILQYSSFDPMTGVTKTTSLNIGKEFQSSVNLNLNTKFGKKWSMSANGSVRFSTVKNNSNSSQSNSGFGGNLFVNTTYTFSPKFTVSNLLGFWKDPQTIQTTYPLNIWYNVAFNYKILKDKVSISLRAVNWFEKNHAYKSITKDQNFYNTNITTQPRRAGVLALTWNFGKLTENVSKKKGVNNDDLLTKPAAPTGN
jgi:outer membrane receptor protein involved in Fe transport